MAIDLCANADAAALLDAWLGVRAMETEVCRYNSNVCVEEEL
jgi:hypothetical protein